MIDRRILLRFSLLTLAASVDVLAAGTQIDTDIARAMLVPAENATPVVSRNASRQQLLEAAGRAVTSHAAELGVAIGQPLQPASVQTSQRDSSVVTYKQTVGNHEVLGARITAVLDAGGAVHALTGGFSPNVKSAGTTAFKLHVQNGVRDRSICAVVGSSPPTVSARNGGQERYATSEPANMRRHTICVRHA